MPSSSSSASSVAPIRLALPKGHIQQGVFALLADAGVHVRSGARSYRPSLSLEGFDTKILKPQTIVEMLDLGSRDLGFAGADWVAELDASLVEVLDTRLDPVRLVAAAPASLLASGNLPQKHLVIATEYVRLAADWVARRHLDATLIRSYGATEVFPPDDADCIVDNTATGSTLDAHGLVTVDVLLESSTRLYANPKAFDDPARRGRIEHLALLLRSVLEARERVLVEVNVSAEKLEDVIAILPCMREPTISQLHGTAGYAVKVAVPREVLPGLIPIIKANGGTDIIVSSLAQIVP